MIRRVTVRAIILHEDKLLCVQQKPYSAISASMVQTNSWATPGGGLDVGEAILAGLEREIIEELGVKPIVGNLLYVQQFAHKEEEQLELFFNIINPQAFLNIDLSKTTHGDTEIKTAEFIEPATSPILPKFLTTENLIEKANGNTPPTIFSYL